MTILKIDRLGLQGDGIAHLDGRDIYVPFSLPGETVEGEIDGDRIPAPRIVTPSPERVAAPCPHFRRCGGCSLQHAREDFIAAWKQDSVARALAAQGLTAQFRPVLTSPPQSRRRATFSGRRTKKSVIVGFHARGSDESIEIPECRLLHPDLMAGMEAYRALTRLGASRKGEIRIAVTMSVNGLDVQVNKGKPLDGPLRVELAALVGQYGLARLGWNDEVVAFAAPPQQRFGKALVTPPAGAFLQATAEGEAALLAAVREIVGRSKRVMDLFAGCGTFTLPLAETAEVHAAEGEAAMMQALDAGWRKAQGLKTVGTETRDLFRRPYMPDELKGFDAVVIDPPRAGAKAQCEELARSTIRRIAFVSCNPVTFARDAKILVEGGYRLDWLRVVDQFRWSGHSELVAQFTRPE